MPLPFLLLFFFVNIQSILEYSHDSKQIWHFLLFKPLPLTIISLKAHIYYITISPEFVLQMIFFFHVHLGLLGGQRNKNLKLRLKKKMSRFNFVLFFIDFVGFVFDGILCLGLTSDWVYCLWLYVILHIALDRPLFMSANRASSKIYHEVVHLLEWFCLIVLMESHWFELVE